MKKLNQEFYERDTLLVAQELLGKKIIHNSIQGITIGKIVETEAYIGPDDPASHAFKNRKSKRTEVQYGPGGYAYVYRIYGLHLCFCIVTQKKGMPEVVLIRALEPLSGIELMEERRGVNGLKEIKNDDLMNGPSKLCTAMGIDFTFYGRDLCGDSLFIVSDKTNNPLEIFSTPRINIDYAGDASKYLWRFLIKDNNCVSRYLCKKKSHR